MLVFIICYSMFVSCHRFSPYVIISAKLALKVGSANSKREFSALGVVAANCAVSEMNAGHAIREYIN
jgi:hypothetical protein